MQSVKKHENYMQSKSHFLAFVKVERSVTLSKKGESQRDKILDDRS